MAGFALAGLLWASELLTAGPAALAQGFALLPFSIAAALVDRGYTDPALIAAMAGYASAEEFIVHCLEKELAGLDAGGSEDEIKKKLKGLGYIG